MSTVSTATEIRPFSIDTPEGPLEMNGDLFSHEFSIERAGQQVATVSKRWFSLTATFGVDYEMPAPGPLAPGVRLSRFAGNRPVHLPIQTATRASFARPDRRGVRQLHRRVPVSARV